MRSSLNSFSRIRTEITFTAYLQDSAFKVQLSQQTLNTILSEKLFRVKHGETISFSMFREKPPCFHIFFQGPQAIHWLHRARVVVVYHGRLTAGSREKMAGSRGSEWDGISREQAMLFQNE